MPTSTQALRIRDYDLYLLEEDTHCRACEKMGVHLGEPAGQRGVRFAARAPNAKRVSVFGNFSAWNPRSNALARYGATAVWKGFVPEAGAGALYKYQITPQYRGYDVDKAGPNACAAEIRPQTASRVSDWTPAPTRGEMASRW